MEECYIRLLEMNSTTDSKKVKVFYFDCFEDKRIDVSLQHVFYFSTRT